jgi:tetratricopeptide (TPR) repeat protein
MAELTHSQARQLIQAASVGRVRAIDQAACDAHLAECHQCQAYANDVRALKSVLTNTLQPRVPYRRPVRNQGLGEYAQAHDVLIQPHSFSIRQAIISVAMIIIALAGANWFLQANLAPAAAPDLPATQVPSAEAATDRQKAQQQYAAGQLQTALALYKKALELEPNNVDNFIQLSRLQLYSGAVADALKTTQDAVTLDPTSSSAHAFHALALDWNGNLNAASDEATKAIQLNPNNALALAAHAEVLLDQQKPIPARDAALQALKLDPQSLEGHSVYGYYLSTIGSYEPARRELTAALALEPANADLHGRLGLLYYHSLNYQQAAIELGCVVDLCPISETQAPFTILPLNHHTLEYYYTYSTLLSLLSTPTNNTCQSALPLNQKIQDFAATDHFYDYVSGILVSNENICVLGHTDAPIFKCGQQAPDCNKVIAQAKEDLGFQIRLPYKLLHDYALTNVGYDLATRRFKVVFAKIGTPLDSFDIFQGVLSSEEQVNWDITRFYSTDVLVPIQIGSVMGQFLPGVQGQNPTDSNDQIQELYWQADGLEYLISRKIPTGNQAEFIALAQAMMGQPASLGTPSP